MDVKPPLDDDERDDDRKPLWRGHDTFFVDDVMP
jgi:hypothetical protein